MGATRMEGRPLKQIRFDIERMVPMLGIDGEPPDIIGTGEAAADRVEYLLSEVMTYYGAEAAEVVVDDYGLHAHGFEL